MDRWEQIKQRVASKLSKEAFQNWFARTNWLIDQNRTIVVAVPDQMTKDWLEQEYHEPIRSAIREVNVPVDHVVFEVQSPVLIDLREPVGRPGGDGDTAPGNMGTSSRLSLNPKFSFDSFVVGSCNQFAHAAAKAVATSPSRSYNPLFIYGGTGMGKTHLMHAIGRSLNENFGSLKIVYTSSERFVNEMVQCIRQDRMPEFHKYYRSADVLMVDDVQTLANKERTQEEFFHTFNELFEHQKQIILSSDATPKSTPGLVDRLRSRFEWGLQVDIQPPDLETKMAILDKKAEAEGVDLPEDVRIFIATRTKTSVRELEGAFVKLVAYASVTDTRINVQMAQQVLKHLSGGTEKRITMDSIIRLVAERHELQPGQLKEKTNAWKISYPRQIAMYLIKELTHASLPEIGRAFGGKHHTTVLHSVQKIEKLRVSDKELAETLKGMIESLS
ncbi:MAG TPA: chromosomal replication initiator protein DnaA [Bryobacteraceae bacterium]|jgi:chromosomal replication initiator protein